MHLQTRIPEHRTVAGLTYGAHVSGPGWSGYWVTSGTVPAWGIARQTPASDELPGDGDDRDVRDAIVEELERCHTAPSRGDTPEPPHGSKNAVSRNDYRQFCVRYKLNPDAEEGRRDFDRAREALAALERAAARREAKESQQGGVDDAQG
ncbi:MULTISPECIES: hypothetical protein [Halorhodospira]|uniref:hypothetical protein n=1 Tax=Halorhodospira TaxID=85108 RepID=UPI001EE96150|nr:MULTISPECIES: hypothetical protein [Halorhodospira]MCG5527349.1 hypothetical protein [Halorhodospira halophila]MCG5543657.1 hypothetical protein [Halorhodospira sp. 9628]